MQPGSEECSRCYEVHSKTQMHLVRGHDIKRGSAVESELYWVCNKCYWKEQQQFLIYLAIAVFVVAMLYGFHGAWNSIFDANRDRREMFKR
jgi:hypothetical protein